MTGGSGQWSPPRRARSFKNTEPANMSLYRRPEQFIQDLRFALIPSSPKERSLRSGVNNSLDKEDENIAADEGISSREIEMWENFPMVPEEGITNMELDDTIFDGLSPLTNEVEHFESLLTKDDVSFPVEDRQSLPLEQTDQGRQAITKEEEIIQRDSETDVEKGAITSANGRKKAKKVSKLERKAQLVLMKVLEETCKGDYTVRVSGDELTTKAKSKHRKDRVTDTGVLYTALISAVGEVMNERGDVFMRGYKQHKKVLEYWMQGPNGEGSTDWIVKDYENMKGQNIKLREDNLMVKEENEMLKKQLEMVQKMREEKDLKYTKMEEKNGDLQNQLRKCRSLLYKYTMLYP